MNIMSSNPANHCANLTCPNKPGEGQFELVVTDYPVVGGHRPLALYLCGPCAEALKSIVK